MQPTNPLEHSASFAYHVPGGQLHEFLAGVGVGVTGVGVTGVGVTGVGVES